MTEPLIDLSDILLSFGEGPARTDVLNGASLRLMPGESAALLSFLYQHVEKPDFQVRFRWQKHSIAFWDNRCTQHLAIWDYYPNVRSGYRVQVEADRPPIAA